MTDIRITDFIFLGVDWLGAFFSLMALGKCSSYGSRSRTGYLADELDLVAQHTFDVLGGVQFLVW